MEELLTGGENVIIIIVDGGAEKAAGTPQKTVGDVLKPRSWDSDPRQVRHVRGAPPPYVSSVAPPLTQVVLIRLLLSKRAPNFSSYFISCQERTDVCIFFITLIFLFTFCMIPFS